MKFLVERKSLPPNDFQKIEAAYNASKRALRDGAGRDAEGRYRSRGMHRHTPQTPRRARKASGSATRGSLAPISGNISMRKVDPGTDGSGRNGGLLHRRISTRSRSAWEFRKRRSEKSSKAQPQRSLLPSLDGTPLRRKSRHYRSRGRTGVAHLHGKDHRAQPRTGAAGRHGGGSPHLRPGQGSSH